MTRFRLRILLVAILCIVTGFALWTMLRPYAWSPDPGARSRIVAAQVKQDRSFFWLDLHLKVLPGEGHDLMKPVRLVTASDRKIEPADTTLGGKTGEGTTDLWFKFWLESADFDGPLELRLNDGSLMVRNGSGLPALGRSGLEVFPTSNW